MTAPTQRFLADFSDQTGIFNPDSIAETITVVGVGGIGASILPTLVTMGFRLFKLIDPDVVEPRNVASQLLFAPCDLYRPKVEVARDYLLRYGATDVRIERRRFVADDVANGGIVISGVDTMATRQEIWGAVKDSPTQLYLDGRIGGQHTTLFAVEPFDGDWYENRWLFDDSKAAPLPCAQRAIAYPAVALGALMASHLARFSRGEMPPKRVEFNLGSLYFQVVGER